MGLVQLYNAETGKKTWVNSNSESVRLNYLNDYKRLEHQLFNEFKKSGIDYVSISTEDNFMHPLMLLFQQRGK